MSTRSRILGFGSAAVLVLAGAASAALAGGLTRDLLVIGLISAGLLVAVSLMFLEVGLSEDQERAREDERRRKRAPEHVEPPRLGGLRRRRRG
jgi:hypothetical protein